MPHLVPGHTKPSHCMFAYHHLHRVRYDECDPMGYFYHARFVPLFDAARTEALRSLGLSYRRLEANGVIMPVIDLSVRYRRPLHYDDVTDVLCRFPEVPVTRLRTEYEVRRLGEREVLASAAVTLCFVDVKRSRPVRAPERLSDALAKADGLVADAPTGGRSYACPICREIHARDADPHAIQGDGRDAAVPGPRS